MIEIEFIFLFVCSPNFSYRPIINRLFIVAEAPAEFMTPLSDKKVTEFETVIFECEVSKPNLKPRWFKGQQEIKDMERFEQMSVGTKHTLTIRECEVQDADTYKIVVEEGVESAANLTVEGTSTVPVPSFVMKHCM